MKGSLSKYLILTKTWKSKNKKTFEKIIANLKDVKVYFLNDIRIKRDILEQILSYEGLEYIVVRNKMGELENMKYKDAVDLIYNNQKIYLSVPFYYVYKSNFNEVIYVETNIGDIKSRFDVGR